MQAIYSQYSRKLQPHPEAHPKLAGSPLLRSTQRDRFAKYQLYRVILSWLAKFRFARKSSWEFTFSETLLVFTKPFAWLNKTLPAGVTIFFQL